MNEVTPSDTSNLAPNVIKVENRYYEVTLKQTVFGDGSSSKYFKWSKDDAGICLVETNNPSEAALTVLYNSEDTIKPTFQENGTLASVNKIYLAQDIQKIIAAKSEIGTVSSTFVGNNIEITGSNYDYSAIMTEADGEIENITSSFIGNNVSIDDTRTVAVYGTLVKALGNIDNITSEFIGNSVNSTNTRINGGIIQAPQKGVIGNITSDFILNKVSTNSSDIEGAVIGNSGTINTINEGLFINNFGSSKSGNVYGGSIYNDGRIVVINDTIFSGNLAKSLSGSAFGGAIYAKRDIDEICNTIFTANSAQGKNAHGGAIYTDANLKISSNNGKRTEFTDNYIVNNGVKSNEAIYVGSKNATLTLSATDSGNILLNDLINGEIGYNVILTGDNSGTISIFDNIENANITINGVNVNTADGKYFNYDFLSLNSMDSANYTIDINFINNTADTFKLGETSRGTIYLSNLNLIGGAPTQASIIQVIKGPDTVSLGVTQDFIDKFHKITRNNIDAKVETINATSTWNQEYFKHNREEVITEGVKTAITDSNRLTADSLEYYIEKEIIETGTEKLGDTLALLNRDLTGTRNFNALEASDIYNITEDLGKTANGQINVRGKILNNKLSKINANGHTLFEIGNSASAYLENMTITNIAETDGALLNIAQGGSATIGGSEFNIVATAGTNGIVNNGTLTFQTGNKNLNTNIIGEEGTLNFNSVIATFTDGASVNQSLINVIGSTLKMNTGSIYGDLQIGTGSNIYISADGLKNEITNNKGNIYLSGGTLKNSVSGTGQLWINGNVTFEDLVTCPIYLNNNGGSLTTNADYIGTQIIKGNYYGPRILNLTGGTLNYNIDPTLINIYGDVTFKDGLTIYTWDNGTYIHEGASLTTNGSNFVSVGEFINNGLLNFTGGTYTRCAITGSGQTNIIGDVTSNSRIAQAIHIDSKKSLKINADNIGGNVDNLGTLYLTGGTLNKTITGEGGLINTVSGTTTSNVKLEQDVLVNGGTNLYVGANNVGHDITTNGNLWLRNGTLAEDYTITGSGTTLVDANNTVTNNAHINTKIQRNGTLITNADLIGGVVTGGGTLNLTGGTLTKNVSDGSVLINNNNSVTSNAVIASTINVNNGGILTIGASNVKGTANVNSDGHLRLLDGTIDQTINGNATTNIVGYVKTTNKRINSKINIDKTGTITSDMDLLRGAINNEGNLYITGVLNKTISGEGTTHIDRTLDIKSNGTIQGIFDLNNGILNSAKEYKTYQLGTVINSGTLNFGLDMSADNINDKFVLNQNSTGIFNISQSSIDLKNLGDNLDRTYQVLFGNSNAKLAIDSTQLKLEMTHEEEDELLEADVFYDKEYNINVQTGTLLGEVQLTTSANATAPDSIHITTGETDWGEEVEIRADLLRALNQLDTEEVRHFRFKTADDNYLTLDNLGKTTSGEINIHGVYDSESGKRSTVNMDGNSGFEISSANTINIYDVEFKNSSNRMIKANKSSIGTVTVDKDGNETLLGGIVNSALNNNSVIDKSNTPGIGGGALYDENSIISQIKDSEFKNNYIYKTNTDIYQNSGSTIAGAMYLKGTQIGSQTSADGGIINTVFENNYIDGQPANTDAAYGGAIYAENAFISQITDSTFKDNIVKNLPGNKLGGAIYLLNTQVGLMDTAKGGIINTTFENNGVSIKTSQAGSTRGGAMTLQSTNIFQIKDSTFKNNYIDNVQGPVTGGGLYINTNSQIGTKDTNLGGIINTIFDGNNITGYKDWIEGSAICLVNGSYISNIKDSVFTNNTLSAKNNASADGTLYMYASTIHNIENTTFSNNTLSGTGVTGGGAIYTNNSSTIDIIKDCTFSNNSTTLTNKEQGNGGAIIANKNTTIKQITDSSFSDNYATYSGGAIHVSVSSKIGSITGTVSFDTESEDPEDKLASIKSTTTFENNSCTHAGGAIAVRSNSSIDEISGVLFKDNKVIANGRDGFGAGIALFSNEHTNISSISDSYFIGNTIQGNNSYGGAIHIGNTSTLGITNSVFKDNQTIATGWASGSAIDNFSTISELSNLTFINNYSQGANARGAIYNRSGKTITKAENLTFIGNHAYATNSIYGGAICQDGIFTTGIVNSTFKDNYLITKSATAELMGGAILVHSALNLIAKDNFTSEFSGNYIMREGNENSKDYQAISIFGGMTLTLDANTNGRFLFLDNIRGSGETSKVILTGDETGTISLYNNIHNASVTAEKVNIDTADSKLFDYNFLVLNSNENAKYGIDIDFKNSAADTFTVGTKSSGKMFINKLNILNNADKKTTVQIIKGQNSNLQLALDENAFNIQTDIIANLGNLVLDNEIYHQNAGLALGKTNTINDSITQLIDETYDNLNIIGASIINNDRTFMFNSENTYNVSTDLDNIAKGSFTIKGLENSTSVIDADGHKLFNLDDETNFSIVNTKITGNDTIINVNNELASINLRNAYIDGDIIGSKQFTIDINGQENTISGNIEHATTTLSAGDLKFGKNTFAHSTDTLSVVNGSISLNNGIKEDYIINKLTSSDNVAYAIDLDLGQLKSDTITVNDKTSSGTITISNLNIINSMENRVDFITQVLNTNGNSKLSLELDKFANTHYYFEDIKRFEEDTVLSITNFGDTFNKYERKGVLYGDIYLTTTATKNDSLGFKVSEEWENSRTFVETLGDTLSMVNQARIGDRSFVSIQATDIYNVTDNLGKTADGTLTINGVTDGDEQSTINLQDFSGFELGENGVININNTTITSNSSIIDVKDGSAVINLNNANISGDITGDEQYNVNISGSGATTLAGNINNAYVTLNNGDLIFDKESFADSGSTLNLKDGSVKMNNNNIDDYVINNLISNEKVKYAIDVDLTNAIADTITVNSGSGTIMLEQFNILGILNASKDEQYTIQILHSDNSDIQLQLSEYLQSGLNNDIDLGTDHIIVDKDEIDPNTLWSRGYWITEQDYLIKGRLNLSKTDTENDSLHLFHLSHLEGETHTRLGDTLKLWSQLETDKDRTFFFETTNDVYHLTESIGTTTNGKMDINGIADANDKSITSKIDMHNKAGFGLSSSTELTISNTTFENINFKDGSLINVTNESGVVNLNNVYITDTICSNAITNAGTVNLTDGNVVLNTGITGKGSTNVTGADVVFGDGISIIQQAINVQSGSLTMADNGVINGSLSIAQAGTVTAHTTGLVSAVSNDGNINLTGGTLTQNISGEGTTNIIGEVINSSKIDNNIDIQSGSLTSSADDISGEINNDSDLILTGTLEKFVTGQGTTTVNKTLKLATGSGFEGELNLNYGAVSTKDSIASDYHIGKMTGIGDFTIDVDLSNANPKSDKFIVGEGSNGTVYIDSINFIPSEDKITKEFKVQILETNGNDAIQLALNEEISRVDRKVGRTSRAEQDTVLAHTDYKDIYNNYTRGGDVYGNIVLGTTKTKNDSLIIKIDETKTVWDEVRDVTTPMGDTLALWNTLKTDEDKLFTINEVDTYKVSENTSGVGKSEGLNLTIKGTSESETLKATIDLNKKTGFELGQEQTLNIQDTKLTGSETLISVSSPDANINLKDSFINGNITGEDTYNIQISGEDVTTINGTITNSDTTLTKGGLKFNTDTFEKSSLNTIGGNVLLANEKIENYIINNLESTEGANYTIDVDLSDNGSADTLHILNSGSGTVVLDTLNIVGSIENVCTDYKIQILFTENDNLQLALSKNAQDQLGQDYVIGKSLKTFDDKIKEVTNWQDIYNRYQREDLTYGKLTLSTKNTTNDSLGITVSKIVEGEKELVGPLGDTLRLVNNAENISKKIFEFNTEKDEYKVSQNLEQTKGSVIINGIQSDEGEYSKINFEEHSGFEPTEASELEISKVELKNAKAKQGSVINARVEDANIKLTNVYIANNNITGAHGAAIYSNSDIEIAANDGYTTISGNSTETNDEAVYMGRNAKLTLNVINKGIVDVNDKINGENGYHVRLTGDKTGNIYLRNTIDNAKTDMDTTTVHLSSYNHFETSNVNVHSGTLDLVNSLAQQQLAKSFHVSGSFIVNADVDLNKEVMDRLPSNTTIDKNAFIKVNNLNLLTDTNADSVAIPFAYKQFKENVKYIGPEVLSKETQLTAFAPIYKYSVRYESRADQGYFVFGKRAGFNPSTSDAYNPAVLASPIATQAAGQSAMNEAFRYVFEHADAFTQFPLMERISAIKTNEYALSTDYNHNLGSLCYEHNNKAGWFRPYSTFESINLSNGPKVNSINYGSLVGFDTDFRHLKHGWHNVGTGYIGYNGSQLHYQGNSTTMNGGLVGLTETFYKGNFWTAITATAGAGVAETHTMYGKEDSTMLMAGIGSKTGYNLEFKEGKYIVQPIMFMSYTFVNTLDYTNAAGVRIKNNPMHTVQINPSIRFISNLKGGWQPYAQVGMIWNLFNEASSSANGVKLPTMHTKPYIEYGVGVQKNIKDNFTAFTQAMIRNGGKNGIALTAGFRWAIGKNTDSVKEVKNQEYKKSAKAPTIIKQLPTNKKSMGLNNNSSTTKTNIQATLKHLQ